jgi:hypothetical protein
MFWSSIARGLDDAEAVGAFHGDLHEGNVLVAGFRLAIVDFGTSALAGRPSSMQRHARMVHRFAKRLLPELNDYIPAPDIPSLVPPECATRAVGLWVSVAKELRTLDADLPSLTDVDLGRRLNSLGGYCLAPMINLSEPVAAWLASRDVSHQIIQGFLSAARVEMQRQELLPISKVWFGILSNRTVSGHGKLPSGGQELPR